jgi:hypothetical protein
MIFSLGCDERNDAITPENPYRLAATYPTPGIIRWVDAEGNLAAVAMSTAGMRVLDVSDVNSIETVFEYQPDPGERVTRVALDLINHLVFAETGGFPILDYTLPVDSARIGGAAFSGPLNDVEISHELNSLTIWGTDDTGSDGFVATHYCRESDTSEWVFGCDFFWQGYTATSLTVSGFDLNDSIFAIAADWTGVHLHRADPPGPISDVATPGIANDCAWYGNHIIVADEFSMTVIDASDVQNPEVVNRFVIEGADRLAWVQVSGNYAILLDTNDGLYVVDISNLLSPNLVQQISLPEPTALDADGNRLYVADQAIGLLIFER